jgi:hypothetical protein
MIFDRQGLRAIQGDFERAMAATAESYGVSLTMKGARFTNANATIKFEICATGPNGEVHSPEAAQFKIHAGRYGLKASDLGGVFTDHSGDEIRITGLKTRRPKYPICGERVRDGRKFKFHQATIFEVTHK